MTTIPDIIALAKREQKAAQRCAQLGMMNTATNPADREQQHLEYRIAETELMRAKAALRKAQEDYAGSGRMHAGKDG